MAASEETLLREARSCDDCVPWLKHCDAVCCREFTFTLSPEGRLDRSRPELRVRVQPTEDLRRYLELRGAKLEGSVVVVPMDRCTMEQGIVHVAMSCSALQEDGLCSLHPDGKPEICQELTLETARDSGYWIDPRCLFAYKTKAMSQSEDGDSRA